MLENPSARQADSLHRIRNSISAMHTKFLSRVQLSSPRTLLQIAFAFFPVHVQPGKLLHYGYTTATPARYMQEHFRVHRFFETRESRSIHMKTHSHNSTEGPDNHARWLTAKMPNILVFSMLGAGISPEARRSVLFSRCRSQLPKGVYCLDRSFQVVSSNAGHLHSYARIACL